MTYVPTGPWEYIKQPQFTEEVTYGTLPLNNTTFTSCGLVTEVTREFTIENEQYRNIGSRDIYAQIKLGEQHTFSFKYRPIPTVSTNFMKYGTELPSGTGTNAKSISILVSKNINDTELYKVFTGVKTASITIEVTRAGGVNVTHNFKCKNITEWGSEPSFTGTTTYATDPTAEPFTGISSGSNPLTIAAANYDTPRFSVTVDQGLTELKPNGELTLKYLYATNRSITVDFDTWVNDSVSSVLNAAQAAYTAQAASYKLNASPSIDLTFTSLKFDSATEGDTAGGSEFTMAKFSGTAKTVVLSQT
jgi:hypothetical protein